MMRDFFAGRYEEGHVCLLDIDDDQPVAVAYYQPTPATDRCWTLLMIAVDRDRQGQGRGSALLRRVEDDLRDRAERLLLIETSGVAGFELTRRFYTKAGYAAEARVRDYYPVGDDMVLFRKDLTTDAPDGAEGPDAARPADSPDDRSS